MTPTQFRGLPKLGQGARIIVAGESHPQQITVRIQAVSEDGSVTAVPLAVSGAANLIAGLPLTLEYFLDEAIYRLTTHVRGLGDGADANVVHLAAPQAVKKLQRRRFPRLSIQLPVTVLAVPVPLGFEQDDKLRRASLKQWSKQAAHEGVSGLTEVLSASGLRVACAPFSHDGATVFVHFTLDKEPVAVTGLVTWVGAARAADFKSAYGIEFVAMREEDRQRIADFVQRAHDAK